MMMIMMRMMMNCFCGMADSQNTLSIISSRDQRQRFYPSQTSKAPRAKFEHAQIRNTDSLSSMKLCSIVNHCTIANPMQREKFQSNNPTEYIPALLPNENRKLKQN